MSSGGITMGPLPDPWITAREVTVTVPVGLAGDLDRMNQVIKNVMTQLGHPNCHSGFDLRFRQSLDFVVSPKGDVAQGIAQPFLG
ncbi:hypothetical protein ACIQI7_27375 [Kitasatospora sp. NPDC092039]|uniref:hypothetical protein n=1 Tax=unclassified Kitasatospora TaxID=2633591 RepID=UPI0036AD7D0C